MINRKSLLLVICSVIVLMVALPSLLPSTRIERISTLLIPMNTAELTENSDTIVIGLINSILPPKEAPSEVGAYKVYTDVVIKVEKYLKNPLQTDEIIVRTPGGKIDGKIWLIVSQSVEFETGERVLLFLARDLGRLDGNFYVAGRWQGKYTLEGDMAYNEDRERNTTVEKLMHEIEDAVNKPPVGENYR